MELIICTIGAIASILISIIGAFISYRYSRMLENRKLKEKHYLDFLIAVHHSGQNNTKESLEEYTLHRDKLLLVGSEKVVKNLLFYEKTIDEKKNNEYNDAFTILLESMRNDLGIRSKSFPIVGHKKA